MTKPAISGAATLRAKNTFAAEPVNEVVAVEAGIAAATAQASVQQQNPAKPSLSNSKREMIVDLLAGRAARGERLPLRVTVADEEITTEAFLESFAFDRRSASAMLQRIAPEQLGGNVQTNECVAVLRFMLDDQKAKAAEGRAKLAKPAQAAS